MRLFFLMFGYGFSLALKEYEIDRDMEILFGWRFIKKHVTVSGEQWMWDARAESLHYEVYGPQKTRGWVLRGPLQKYEH